MTSIFPSVRRLRTTLVFCVTVLCPVLFHPNPVSGLSLSEALKLSENHPVFKELEIGVRQAKALAMDAGKRSGDSLTLESENVGADLPGFSQAETTLSYSRPLQDHAKVKAARHLAGQGIERASFEENRMRWEISSNVQTAFHTALVQQDLLAVAFEGETIARLFADIARERVSAGAAPESEILKAELALNLAEKGRRLLEKEVEQAKLGLAREIGIASLSDPVLVGSLSCELSFPSFETLETELEARHPDFQAFKLAEQQARATLAKLRADNRPGYSVMAGVRDYRVERNRGLLFGVTMELPNRKANAGERAAVVLEQDRIGAEREKKLRDLQLALKEAFQRCLASRAIAKDLNDNILPASQRLLELTLESYQLGKADQILALEAQKTVVENRRDYVLALADLYSALNLIEKLCGVCLVNEHH